MINLKLFVSQFNRLVSRDTKDIIYFLKYKLRMIPTSFMDYYYGGIKILNYGAIDKTPNRIINKNDPLISKELIAEEGKKIVKNGEVELLGKVINIGWPPKWETNETGIWSKKSSNKIQYYGAEVQNDIKLIWELHRLQWLPSVSAYYANKNDNKDSEVVLDIIIDYIDLHPFGRTISWMEGIEITLRSISIIETLAYIKEFEIENKKIEKIYSYLACNAQWLDCHLSEKWRRNNNHLLLELIGLMILGEYLEWHPKAKKWKKRAIYKLSRELRKQTFNKRNWEPTTAYHRFVTESLLVMEHYCGTQIKVDNNINLIRKITKNLVESLYWMSDVEGRMPVIGDDDAGIVCPRVGGINASDNNPTLSLSKKLGYKKPDKIDGIKLWSEQGMGVLHNGNMTLNFVSGAPKGIGRQASHRHLDMLSISLNHKGNEIILDGGTGVYFGSNTWRDYFRSEKCHSGIYSGRTPWAKISNLFEIKNPPYGEMKNIKERIKITCLHPSGIKQIRKIINRKKQIIIEDNLNLDDPIIAYQFKDIGNIKELGDEWIMELNGIEISHSPIPKKINIQNISNGRINLENEYDGKAYYSPSYGVIKHAARVEFIHEKGTRAITIIKEL